VERHYRLVYSTCRRELGDNVLAEDAVQVVFLILARKAKSLRNEVVLGGWLFQTARFTAMDIRKQEIRRRLRDEKVGHVMLSEVTPGDGTWAEIDPVLDDSLAELCDKDRIAVVLRFFEDASFADIAQALGQKEDAARHRLGRALAKMHKFLTKNGVVVPVSALGTLLAANALKPASAEAVTLAAAKVSSAVGGAGIVLLGSQINLLAQGVIRTMWIKQVGTAAAAVAVTVVVGGVVAAMGIGLVRSNATSLPAASTPPQPSPQAEREKDLGMAVVHGGPSLSQPGVVMARLAPQAMIRNPIIRSIRVVSDADQLTGGTPILRSTAKSASAIDGIWEGTIPIAPGVKLRFVAAVSHDSRGLLTAMLSSPDQNPDGIGAPADTVSFSAGVLTLRDNTDGAAFTGRLAADGATIDGTFAQSGKKLPLVLARRDHPSSDGITVSDEDAAILSGTWQGRLGAGTQSIQIDLTVSRRPSGRLTAAIDSPDQGSSKMPAVLQFAKGVLQCQVGLVDGTYQGTLGPDNTSFTGTWTQYGVPTQPLDLTKSN
jgi:RNA polymerase sigma factor (sigma-70 family)